MITMSTALVDPAEIVRASQEAVKKALKWAASEYVREFTEGISRGVAIDGSSQKTNTEATRVSKTRRGKGTAPLKDSGILASSTEWVIRSEGSWDYSVSPPGSRSAAFVSLKKKGYTVDGFSEGFERKLNARTQAEIQEIQLRTHNRGGRR